MIDNKFFDDEISISVCDDRIKQELTDKNKFKSIEFNISQLVAGTLNEYEYIMPGMMYYNKDVVDILLQAGGHLPDNTKPGMKSAYFSGMNDCIGLSDHLVTYCHYDSERDQYILNSDIIIHLGDDLKKIKSLHSKQYHGVSKSNLDELVRHFKNHLLPLGFEDIVSYYKLLLRHPFVDRDKLAATLTEVWYDKHIHNNTTKSKHSVESNQITGKTFKVDDIERAFTSDKNLMTLVTDINGEQRVVEKNPKKQKSIDLDINGEQKIVEKNPKKQKSIDPDINDKSKGLWAEVDGYLRKVSCVCINGCVIHDSCC